MGFFEKVFWIALFFLLVFGPIVLAAGADGRYSYRRNDMDPLKFTAFLVGISVAFGLFGALMN